MSGVVLETLSWKKLGILIILLLIGQIICFLIGGLITPTPNTYTNILTEKCIDRKGNKNAWFYSRALDDDSSSITCTEKINDDLFHSNIKIDKAQIVFTAQFPLPRDGINFNMSRWFQQIVVVANTDIVHDPMFKMNEEIIITMDVRLGYRNKGEKQWHLLAESREERPLKCILDQETRESMSREKIGGHYYDCELMPLFSLGSCFYEEYLVNIRLPLSFNNSGLNKDLGLLKDFWITEIHQNGGFTMIWFALKTVMFPMTLSALVFFWRRINMLDRKMNLLEQTIISLGIFMSLLNLPVEWLSLIYNFSFWLVLSDIRQGAFYCMLLCFWVIFCGEHQLEHTSAHYNYKSISSRIYNLYFYQLLPVGAGASLLFIFELAERGVQLSNPFYTVWSHHSSARLAIAFIVLAAVCAPCYLAFLGYKIAGVIKQILSKRAVLPSLPQLRQRFYRGIIYRFIIFIIYTLFCATLTVIFFIVSQIDESQWKWGERYLEYTSAFITGVYGMWNFYVVSILCLYAPSHKYSNNGTHNDDRNLLTTTSSNSGAFGVASTEEDIVVKYHHPSSPVDVINSSAVSTSDQQPEITISRNSSNEQATSTKSINPLKSLLFLNKSGRD